LIWRGVQHPERVALDIDNYRRVGAADADGNLLSTEQAGFKGLEQGDATLVWCAISHQLDGMG